MLDVALLGSGGTQPLPNRWLTSLIASCNGQMLLIDCGEVTQVALKMLGLGLKNIDVICLTHYHADHVAGLPGLLLTMNKSGREKPLVILGPEGLSEVVDGLTVIAPYVAYELSLMEIPLGQNVDLQIGEYHLNTMYVEHTIPCMAYSMEIKRGRKFDPRKAEENDIPIKFWKRLQMGEVVEFEGRIFRPELVLGEERRGIKVCYCTDTRPVAGLREFVSNSDLLVCEGMYAEDEKLYKAERYKHMLFSEAAKIAQKGKVKELWLTHSSPSLTRPEMFLKNVQQIYQNTRVGHSGMQKRLSFENDERNVNY